MWTRSSPDPDANGELRGAKGVSWGPHCSHLASSLIPTGHIINDILKEKFTLFEPVLYFLCKWHDIEVPSVISLVFEKLNLTAIYFLMLVQQLQGHYRTWTKAPKTPKYVFFWRNTNSFSIAMQVFRCCTDKIVIPNVIHNVICVQHWLTCITIQSALLFPN